MARYPELETIRYSIPEKTEFRSKVLKSTFDDLGKISLKKKWTYPKRLITLAYRNLTKADFATLRQFYMDNVGTIFSFFYGDDQDNDTYEGEYVGTGNGSTKVWPLPSKEASDRTLYLDSMSQSEGVDWTLATNVGGYDGADSATFTTAPDSGARITYDFTGRLRVRCIFRNSVIETETLYSWWKRLYVELEGCLNDE